MNDARVITHMAYLTSNNFVGRPIQGYKKNVCIATEVLINKLSLVQDELDKLKQNFALKVFDAYRPQSAVDDFIIWSKDKQDIATKEEYYPDLSKEEIFSHGYVLARSTHSRGGAVDLTIAKKVDNAWQELEMGTRFDFFGKKSHSENTDISLPAIKNRKLLRSLMEKHGFVHNPKEWWHFNVEYEMYPDTYFDFNVE